MAITPQQLAKKLRILRTLIKKNQNRIEIVALQRLEGEMKRRIHNKGQASDGSLIGQYLSNHRKKREKSGKQTRYVDLQYDDDLKESVEVGKDGKQNVLGFTLSSERLKAEGHEKFRKKRIYKPQRKEHERAIKTAAKEIQLIFRKAFK